MEFVFTIAAIVVTVLTGLICISLRRVVAPNEVHIVQSSRITKSYGKDTPNGNTYYEWPAWVPVVGITHTILPVSVFDITLKDYEAYDQGKVPFLVDVIGFFRIEDTNLAAQRVQSFADLEQQLTVITQGSVRTVLAAHDIDSIMVDRSKFGTAFTEEVLGQLKEWGVTPVKSLELMDIRDVNGGQSIHNIMQKKKSLIEAQSRIEVAKNQKDATIAEISAQQEAETSRQASLETVGLRTAQKDQNIGIANQQASQAIQEQAKTTKEKEMAVLKVAQTEQANIDLAVGVTKADQARQTMVLQADGVLEQQKKLAEGVQVNGLAKAAAEKAMQLAPVEAQIVLAKEIGMNENYQKYLVTIRQVEANQAVGMEQAKALENADIKVIANSGTPTGGVSSVRELFSAEGGMSVGSMLEGLAQTDTGKSIINVVTGRK